MEKERDEVRAEKLRRDAEERREEEERRWKEKQAKRKVSRRAWDMASAFRRSLSVVADSARRLSIASQDHYGILGIDRNATTTEIRAAYKKLSLETHPDKGGDEERFKEVRSDNRSRHKAVQR